VRWPLRIEIARVVILLAAAILAVIVGLPALVELAAVPVH
jgi:hypothetical protein